MEGATETDFDLTPDTSPQEMGEGSEAGTEETSETTSAEETPQQPVSRVNHNAFRGNNSNGISAARNVPVKWNLATGANIAWKVDNPRAGFGSPVINGNKVFFSGADEQARELFCYDLTTGEKLWSLVADNIPGSPAKPPEVSDEVGLAASGVATNGNQVCAIFATGDLICADMNGKRLWAKNLGVPVNHWGYVSSLLTFGNLLIVQYDNQNIKKVFAFDIATGAERWNKDRTERSLNWGSPMIANINGTPQLVLIGCPGVTAYNPNNGNQLWRVEFLSGEPTPSACSANGIVYIASEYAKMVAINAADGTVLWENNDFLPDVASPVATKDNVYIATSFGVVASFDTQTGKLRVEHELGETFYSSPMIADGKMYAISLNGKVHVFSANDEFKLLESFDTGEETFATPAFTDGKIVVRTEKSIYCVSAN
jgi:outer membrane protein assembly factor BamB